MKTWPPLLATERPLRLDGLLWSLLIAGGWLPRTSGGESRPHARVQSCGGRDHDQLGCVLADERGRLLVHRRYFALPSTTPECDSFFAKQSCAGNRCVSHHVLAS